MNIFQELTFFRGEYFSGVNIFHGLIFFRDEYFSGGKISQFKFRIHTDYFGLVFTKNVRKFHKTHIPGVQDSGSPIISTSDSHSAAYLDPFKVRLNPLVFS